MGNTQLLPTIIVLLCYSATALAAYAVNPKSSIIVEEQTHSVFVVVPGAADGFEVYNIGKVPIYAEFIYGVPFKWLGPIRADTINPGERKYLAGGGKSYYSTALKVKYKGWRGEEQYGKYQVYSTKPGLQPERRPGLAAKGEVTNNDPKWRGLFETARGGDFRWGGSTSVNDDALNLPDIDENATFKGIVAFGVKQISDVGAALSSLVTTFWPNNKKNVWDEIKDKVQNIVDKSALDTIETVLNADIKQYKERISVLASEFKYNRGSDAASHYMEIAHNMIGLEKKFIVSSDRPNYKKINHNLLPLYSNVVTLKMAFYVLGLRRARDIGLNANSVNNIKNYMTTLIRGRDGANNYIDQIYEEQLLEVYNTVHANDIYNGMMSMRTYVTVNGLEYLVIWKQLLDHPESYEIPYNDHISYSNFFGRSSINLIEQALPDRQNLQQPLTPKLINGRRNKLTKIFILHWRIKAQFDYGPTKIGGLHIVYENGDEYRMGESKTYGTNADGVIELNGATITKLRVGGRAALDFLQFYLSDGRVEKFGYEGDNRGVETTFELKDHHIVGFFLGTAGALMGQAANIAVSYQLNDNIGKL